MVASGLGGGRVNKKNKGKWSSFAASASTGPFTKPGAIRPSKLASGIPLENVAKLGKCQIKNWFNDTILNLLPSKIAIGGLPILMATVATRWRYRKR